MKFDVIIGNPPYQLSDAGGTGTSAIPLYNLFVLQSTKLRPRYLSMIIPSRWFAGGKGLDEFRRIMINDRHISHLVDYPIASDVFPGVRIIGGVCFFLWQRDYDGPCNVTTVMNGTGETLTRDLNEFDIFIRFNKAISIVRKISAITNDFMDKRVSSRMPFGLTADVKPKEKGDITLYALKKIGKIEHSSVSRGTELIYKWKVLISKGYGEGGESREYPRMIIGKPIVASPPSACTETYLIIDAFDTEKEAFNLASYIRTKFFRFLVGLAKNTQNISKKVFTFVPIEDYSRLWTDEELYQKYGLTADEIAFIEQMIRPMPADDNDKANGSYAEELNGDTDDE